MFIKIDFDNWDRKDIYTKLKDLTFNVTVDCDITNLIIRAKKAGLKLYPLFNYCIAKVINDNVCFRYAIQDEVVGYYDSVDILYTLMRNNDAKLFTHKMTKYNVDFLEFYKQFEQDRLLAENSDKLYYDDNLPKSIICTSILPKLKFRTLSYNYVGKDSDNFIPFVCCGKYEEENGKILMPVSAEFHHEVCDGYHCQLFFEELEKAFEQVAELINQL